MQVNDNGTASYFAVLEKSSAAQKERIEKRLQKRKKLRRQPRRRQKRKRMRSGWKRNAKKPEMSMILTIRRL